MLKDSYLHAEQPAPAPHRANPDGCAVSRRMCCTSRRVCCPTHCAGYCDACQPLLRATRCSPFQSAGRSVQSYLAGKKTPPTRTLKCMDPTQAYKHGPGARLLMRQVTLFTVCMGTSLVMSPGCLAAPVITASQRERESERERRERDNRLRALQAGRPCDHCVGRLPPIWKYNPV